MKGNVKYISFLVLLIGGCATIGQVEPDQHSKIESKQVLVSKPSVKPVSAGKLEVTVSILNRSNATLCVPKGGENSAPVDFVRTSDGAILRTDDALLKNDRAPIPSEKVTYLEVGRNSEITITGVFSLADFHVLEYSDGRFAGTPSQSDRFQSRSVVYALDCEDLGRPGVQPIISEKSEVFQF